MQIENLLVKRPRTNQCRYTKLIKLVGRRGLVVEDSLSNAAQSWQSGWWGPRSKDSMRNEQEGCYKELLKCQPILRVLSTRYAPFSPALSALP